MSSLLRAWYVLIALGFVTFIFTAFLGQAPHNLSSAVATPLNLFFTATSNVREVAISLRDRRDLRAENATLSEDLAELKTSYRELELALERATELLDVQTHQSSGALLSVPVAGLSSSSVIKELQLAKGTSSGVVKDMPVTTTQGLVGIVTGVSANRATVRTLIDPQSRIGVTVRGKGGQGVAVGLPGGGFQIINYREVTEVEKGDVIETSSLGGFFPRGILVGEVAETPRRNANNLQIDFLAEPAVDVTTLLEVILIRPQ